MLTLLSLIMSSLLLIWYNYKYLGNIKIYLKKNNRIKLY